MARRVDSLPPWALPLEVRPGRFAGQGAPFCQVAMVPSQKYFIGAAMLPKRQGAARARPMHSGEVGFLDVGRAAVGTSGALASQTVETRGRCAAWPGRREPTRYRGRCARRAPAPNRGGCSRGQGCRAWSAIIRKLRSSAGPPPTVPSWPGVGCRRRGGDACIRRA